MPEKMSSCNICGSRQLEDADPECHITKCVTCGFVFDNPRPTLEEITTFYSAPSKYDNWLAMESERESLWERRLRKVSRHKKDGNVLDIGTGTGQFLFVAKQHFTNVYGTEVSGSAVAVAKARYGLDVIKGNIEEIEFAGLRFDNITLFHVLEHVLSLKAVIEKCRNLLVPGGILYIAIPNELQSFRNIIKKFMTSTGIHKFRFSGKLGLPRIVLDGTLDELHLSHFTPAVLSAFVEQNGFRIVEEGLDPYFVQRGWKLFKCTLYYVIHSVINKVSGKNLYDTMWLVAQKPLDS
jgi:2-polyprenyl-3-methyl-5-hydroxy-6-metoxy-1,4-benzoquinol methylase